MMITPQFVLQLGMNQREKNRLTQYTGILQPGLSQVILVHPDTLGLTIHL